MKFNHSSKIFCFFILVVVMSLITSCGLFKPSITNAFMTKLGQTDPKYAPEEIFSQLDNPYIFMKLRNASEKTNVRTVLTNLTFNKVLVDESYKYKKNTLVDGYFVIQFFLMNAKYFPIGKYQVDIYLDKELEKSVNFKIQ